jgi:hypothetical protein
VTVFLSFGQDAVLKASRLDPIEVLRCEQVSGPLSPSYRQPMPVLRVDWVMPGKAELIDVLRRI